MTTNSRSWNLQLYFTVYAYSLSRLRQEGGLRGVLKTLNCRSACTCAYASARLMSFAYFRTPGKEGCFCKNGAPWGNSWPEQLLVPWHCEEQPSRLPIAVDDGAPLHPAAV